MHYISVWMKIINIIRQPNTWTYIQYKVTRSTLLQKLIILHLCHTGQKPKKSQFPFSIQCVAIHISQTRLINNNNLTSGGHPESVRPCSHPLCLFSKKYSQSHWTISRSENNWMLDTVKGRLIKWEEIDRLTRFKWRDLLITGNNDPSDLKKMYNSCKWPDELKKPSNSPKVKKYFFMITFDICNVYCHLVII